MTTLNGYGGPSGYTSPMEEGDCQTGEAQPGCKMGRPRSETARQAILRAADDLLARDGFAAVTVEAIAAQAGVGKATIYRWWPGKAAVVMDAFLLATGPCSPFPDTGCLEEDLRGQMHLFARTLGGPAGLVMRGVLAEAQSDPEAAEAFRTHYLAPRRAETRRVLERARMRGQVCSNADLETVADALYGPLLYRLMAGHAPLDAAFVDALLAVVFQGLRPACPFPK